MLLISFNSECRAQLHAMGGHCRLACRQHHIQGHVYQTTVAANCTIRPYHFCDSHAELRTVLLCALTGIINRTMAGGAY